MSCPPIRPAGPSDLAALAELERDCFDSPWAPRDLAEALALDRGLVLVETASDGAIAGYVLCLRLGEEAEVLRLATAAPARRSGVGSRLLAAALDHLRERGVRRVWLEVRPSNRTARRLYSRHGFRHEGTRRRYYADGEDALLYVRDEGERPPPAAAPAND